MVTEFLQRYNLSIGKIFKMFFLGIAGFLVIAIAFVILRISTNSYRTKSVTTSSSGSYKSGLYSNYLGLAAPDSSYSGTLGLATGESDLSLRNIFSGIMPLSEPTTRPTTGSDAENFEITEYSGYIETTDAAGPCSEIANLKSRDHVIFENATKQEKSCHYRFKVKRENVEEVLAVIKKLNPKEFKLCIR